MAKTQKNKPPAVEATAGANAPEAESGAIRLDDKLLEKASALFKLHPLAKTLYFTSDGTAFFQLQDAANHSESLEEKKVKPINRQEV